MMQKLWLVEHREIETVRPLRDGVIADFNMTDGLLQGYKQNKYE